MVAKKDQAEEKKVSKKEKESHVAEVLQDKEDKNLVKQEDASAVDERELLAEAEEREKERKAEEEIAKAEAKEAEKEAKAEEKEEKVARKVSVRRKPRHGKKYRKLAELIEKDKEYPVGEAIELALKTSPSKFDATAELHVKINIKEKNIRGMVTLPGGVVKEKKLLEVTEKNVDEVVAQVKAGKIDFDIMIADLKIMPRLAVLAKVLGPKGLMPSPKAGTAVVDVEKAAEELKSGKVEYRADKDNIVHMAIGKISYGQEKIWQNYEAVVSALPSRRIDSIHITTTMGPSIKVSKK